MIVVLLISFVVLLALRFPIAVALGLSSAIGLAYQPMASPALVAQRMFVAIDSFPLMAVPLYMLAGYLMSAGGISRRIVEFSTSLVGSVRGGAAHVNVLASMIFGGISGSAVADTAGIGNIMIPGMIRRGYTGPYSAAVTAVSSTLGIIIPPSIPMVIIGGMLGVSVGKLFLGGVVPGVLIAAGMMTVAWIQGGGREEGRFALGDAVRNFGQAAWALAMPVVVIAGIVAGVFTPTEAGALAVVLALIIAAAVYRELTLDGLHEALVHTVLSTARVFLLIATAGLFAWLLTANGFPSIVGGALTGITESPQWMLLLLALILVGVTTFMESIAAMILLLPILFPVSVQVGIDPIHFGVVVVVSVGIGLVTPPVGLCLFVASDVAGVDAAATARKSIPFLAMMLVLLLVLIFVPPLITALPAWVMD